MNTKGFGHILILTLIFLGIVFYALFRVTPSPTRDTITTLWNTPTPTEYLFPYKNPTIPKAQSYRTLIVGDSIVATLGANANVLREKLKDRYPENEFVNYNYGYGSTNIESLPDRLHNQTNYLGETNQSILSQGVELIIIESFGFNPLSEYPLEEGLARQTEVLEESVQDILREKPQTALAFMTPIAPSTTNFGRGTIDLNQEQRDQWVAERIAYIDNHRAFAKEKGIPVIDVYVASLDGNGLVNEDYIADDNIHPSKEGIELISTTIADYISENNIFPH